MTSKLKIGLFDSGLGGLTILRENLCLLPDAIFYYKGDQGFHPYGPKSDDEIIERCFLLTKELIDLECQIIIVACNTATAVAIRDLRLRFPKTTFVGVEPYLNLLAHYSLKESDHVGVLVTRGTLESKRFNELQDWRDPGGQLDVLCLDDLAPFIEKNLGCLRKDIGKLEGELRKILSPVKDRAWTHIVLGCTHYPLVANEISKITGAQCLDPALAVAKRVLTLSGSQLSDELVDAKLYGEQNHFFYSSTLNDDAGKWRKKSLSDFY